ncbi:MAG: hypothetical protein IKE43_10145 [Coriobacteriales bacterium]|nr:hypothetical protein [Coriobacteriales bacterium]
MASQQMTLEDKLSQLRHSLGGNDDLARLSFNRKTFSYTEPGILPSKPASGKEGDEVTFLRWEVTNTAGYVSPTATPQYIRTVFCVWDSVGNFYFLTYGGSTIHGIFTDEYDDQLKQYKPALWTDDGLQARPEIGGETAWAAYDTNGSFVRWL